MAERQTFNPFIGPLVDEMDLLVTRLSFSSDQWQTAQSSHSSPRSNSSHFDPYVESTTNSTVESPLVDSVTPTLFGSQNIENINMMDTVATTQPQDAQTNCVTPSPEAAGFVLPPMDSKGGGLASMDRDTLTKYLQPIREALEMIDAESMLHLQRVQSGGARLHGKVRVKPIHTEVTPPKQRNGSVVRYVHLTEVPDKYSIGIFVFPPHAKIPLHDHPGMCVLSRVLYGDLTRLSLDLLRDEEELDLSMGLEPPNGNDNTDYDSERSKKSWFKVFPSFRSSSSSISETPSRKMPEGAARAFLNGTDHLAAPGVTALYPYEGNLHEFVAGPDGAAVLDVLLPPYDVEHGRECTFYNIREDETLLHKSNPRRPCWIIPTGQPEDFHCLSGQYRELGGEEEGNEPS